MKAVICAQYGPPDVLQVLDVEKPAPGPGQVLIKIHAASVNAADWHIVRGEPKFARLILGLTKPKATIPGSDIAGRVEAVGGNVTRFKAGDDVMGCLSESGWGGFAEYVCAPESALVIKPAEVTYEQAAAVPLAAMSALQGLRDKAQIQPGQHVLINGASGGVGTFAVQIAKAFGAEVTAVCSARNMDRVRSLGADHVIDYAKEDFTRNGRQYDAIIAANGYHPIAHYKNALGPNGRYVMIGGTSAQMSEAIFRGPLLSLSGSKKLGMLNAKANQPDLAAVRDLLAAGKIIPVIAGRFPLAQIVDALKLVDEGHAQGKVVIAMPH